jgi:hypothetical protein
VESPLTLNLVCPEGHRWFAPRPELWAGEHECGFAFDRELRVDGSFRTSVRRCHASLRIELPRNSGEVAAVDGLTTLGSA